MPKMPVRTETSLPASWRKRCSANWEISPVGGVMSFLAGWDIGTFWTRPRSASGTTQAAFYLGGAGGQSFFGAFGHWATFGERTNLDFDAVIQTGALA